MTNPERRKKPIGGPCRRQHYNSCSGWGCDEDRVFKTARGEIDEQSADRSSISRCYTTVRFPSRQNCSEREGEGSERPVSARGSVPDRGWCVPGVIQPATCRVASVTEEISGKFSRFRSIIPHERKQANSLNGAEAKWANSWAAWVPRS